MVTGTEHVGTFIVATLILVGVVRSLVAIRRFVLEIRSPSQTLGRALALESRSARAHINMAFLARTRKARAEWIVYAVRCRLKVIRLMHAEEPDPSKHRHLDVNVAATVGTVYAQTTDHGQWLPELMQTMVSFQLIDGEWHYWMPIERIKLSTVPGFYYLDGLNTPDMVH